MNFFLKFFSPACGIRYGILLTASILLISCFSDSGHKTDFHARKSVDENISSGGSVQITSIQLEVKKPFPRARINLHIQGNLPDGCTRINRITQQKKADTFYIQVLAERDSQAFCAQALVPFHRTVALDTEGLSSGGYQVEVQDLKAKFAIGDR